MTEDDLIAIVRIDRQTLEIWVESGWLQPVRRQPQPEYSELDLARARLVADLIGPLGVNAEGVEIILDLLDQVHGLRGAMLALGRTIEAQPDDVRRQLRTHLQRTEVEPHHWRET